MRTHTFIIFISIALFLPAAAQPADKTVFNVRSFGAVGDGTNLDSPAINRAILAAAEPFLFRQARICAAVFI